MPDFLPVRLQDYLHGRQSELRECEPLTADKPVFKEQARTLHIDEMIQAAPMVDGIIGAFLCVEGTDRIFRKRVYICDSSVYK